MDWCLITWLNVGLLVDNLFVAYMYFVFVYVYDYDDWSSYLGCGLLI